MCYYRSPFWIFYVSLFLIVSNLLFYVSFKKYDCHCLLSLQLLLYPYGWTASTGKKYSMLVSFSPSLIDLIWLKEAEDVKTLMKNVGIIKWAYTFKSNPFALCLQIKDFLNVICFAICGISSWVYYLRGWSTTSRNDPSAQGLQKLFLATKLLLENSLFTNRHV